MKMNIKLKSANLNTEISNEWDRDPTFNDIQMFMYNAYQREQSNLIASSFGRRTAP